MNQMSSEEKPNQFAPYSINASHAVVESQRCLGCHDAPCTQACPVHIDVPGFIRRIAQGNLEGSNQLLIERNPLAAVCGLICPTADLCEGACVLPQMGQRPIRIGALQYFVANQFQFCDTLINNDRARRIAVIGSGPSSIGCAVVLRRHGHQVHIFERNSKLGGLVSTVIPSYRLLSGALMQELSRIEKYGIDYHFGVNVTPEFFVQLENQFDAVFLGIGLSRLNPGMFPDSSQSGVRPAMDLLSDARLYAQGEIKKPGIGEMVVVIGGGNVALDAAIVAKKTGAERAIVLYRRSLEEMPAWRSEYLDATAQGVEFRWLSIVKQVVVENNQVRAIEVQPMRRTQTLQGRRRGVEPDPSALTYMMPCDMVLLALGQQLDKTWAEEAGISLTDQGSIDVDQTTHQTRRPGIFAGGEAVIGGATAVHCIADGMAAGLSIHSWLTEKGNDLDG
jgi:dihydropyrimidine dehydrogenase (NAD+) subunit PreT